MNGGVRKVNLTPADMWVSLMFEVSDWMGPMPKGILSFRVESRLLAQFTDATWKANRSPTEVLSEFIVQYVREVRSRELVDTAGSIPILEDPEETKIVDFARESARLRLLHAQKEGERLAQRFLNGETDTR